MSLSEAIDMLRMVDPSAAKTAQLEWEELEDEKVTWENSYDEKVVEYEELEKERDELKDSLDDIRQAAEEALR